MLREFKHLHEVAYPDEVVKDSKGRPLSKPNKIKALQDQKANSIADMAHVLKMQKQKVGNYTRSWFHKTPARFAESQVCVS